MRLLLIAAFLTAGISHAQCVGSACGGGGGGGGGTGTVTTVSVATANGFAGTVANATTTPAITISPFASSGLSDTANLPLLNAAQSFSAQQVVNLSGATAPTFPATTTFATIGGSGANSRELNIAYGGVSFFTNSRIDGTPASKTALLSGEQIGGYNAFGWNGSALGGPTATMQIFATENWSGTAQGSRIAFMTTPNTTTTAVARGQIENDGGLTWPSTVTGGDKGAGSINATSIFVAGVAVSTTTGTVTSIATTGPITGGTITATGTIGCATCGVTGSALSQFAATTSTQLAGVISDETGSAALVFANTPTLVTPVLGVATATSINKVALTAPATSATLTIADGKTLTYSNSITIAGTDATTMTFPATTATIARTDAAQTFTGSQTFTTVVAASGQSMNVNANLGTTISKVGITLANSGATRAPTTGAASQHLQSTGTFAPASGSINFSLFENNWTINQTSTATGIVRGYYDNPILTSGFDYRAIEVAAYTLNLFGTVPTTIQQVLFNAPTLAAGSAKTVTNAATEIITGAPIAGTNVTITNPYAQWIQAGAVRIDGTIIYNGATPAANTVVCYKTGGVMGWASNTAGAVGTTCN